MPVAIDTSAGRIVVALDRLHAPVTTANFLQYVDSHRFDGETIYYRRVEYDINATIQKIYEIPDLENFLGDRLRDGR